MRAHATFCDLCVGEGEPRLATARYWNDEGQEWHCCAKHLKQIKGFELEYEEFDEPGNMEIDY